MTTATTLKPAVLNTAGLGHRLAHVAAQHSVHVVSIRSCSIDVIDCWVGKNGDYHEDIVTLSDWAELRSFLGY